MTLMMITTVNIMVTMTIIIMAMIIIIMMIAMTIIIIVINCKIRTLTQITKQTSQYTLLKTMKAHNQI
jgi:hypothetical protein